MGTAEQAAAVDGLGTPQPTTVTLTTMTMRSLSPGTHLLTRSDGSVQIGIDPDRCLVVPSHSVPALRGWLNGTDEVQVPAGLRALLQATAEPGDAAMDAVQRVNLRKFPAHASAWTEVQVHGLGRLGMTVALVLAGSGLPHVRAFDSRAVTMDDITPWGASRIDVGGRRDHVFATIMGRVRRDAVHRQIYPARTERALAVYAADQKADWPWFDPSLADDSVARDTPHIIATATARAAAVSSIITPGAGGCLRCSFEARADLDAEWPLLSAQIATKVAIDTAPLALIASTALTVVSRVLTWLVDGATEAPSLTTVRWPGYDTINDPWPAHPRCGCSWDKAA